MHDMGQLVTEHTFQFLLAQHIQNAGRGGYRRMLRTPGHRVLDRCARSVALVGAIWLVAAAAFDMAMRLSHLAQFSLYDAPSFWMDVRFYIGWAIGLALAPSPFRQA